MTPTEAITQLKLSGMTEAEIGSAVGVGQSTVNKIRNGVLKDPSYAIGKALVDLAEALPPANDDHQAEAA